MRLVAFTITLKLLEVTKFGISIGIALSLSSVTAIFAEDMEEPLFYHGVRLVVSNSVEVNDDLLKISLGGESFLVQKPGAAREVALRYLRDAKLIDTLHTSAFKQMAQGAANDNDTEVLATLYKGALVASSNVDFNSIAFWGSLIGDSSTAYGALAGNLESSEVTANLPRVCAALSAANRESVRSGSAEKLERLNQNIGAECLDLTLRSTIEATLAGLTNSAETDLPVTINSAQKVRVDSAIALIESIDRDIVSGDALSFRDHLELLLNLAKSLGVSNLSSAALSQRFIDSALSRGEFAGALRELVKIPFDERTPKTHRDLTSALKGLTSAGREVVSDPEFRRVINLYAGKDSEISFEWEALNKRAADSLIKDGDIDLAQDANASLILPITLVSLLLGVAAIFRRKIQRRLNSAGKSEPVAEYPDEYLEALKVFGLSPKASLKDIKRAYRLAVKKHHPDLKNRSNQDDQLFFIRLNLEYEKLLKLHQGKK
jgi:DnaJ-domain-containing protein 1